MYCSIVKLKTKFIVRSCNKVKNNGEIKIKKARRFNETMKILKISEIYYIFLLYFYCEHFFYL